MAARLKAARLGQVRSAALGAVLSACASAHAAMPETMFGMGAQYRSPQEARGLVLGEMELLNYLGARLEAAVGLGHSQFKSVLWAGPTLSLDVTSWAPSLFVGLGWRCSPNVLTGTLRAELRRYVSLHSAIGAGVGAEWTQGDSTQLSATLGYFYRL